MGYADGRYEAGDQQGHAPRLPAGQAAAAGAATAAVPAPWRAGRCGRCTSSAVKRCRLSKDRRIGRNSQGEESRLRCTATERSKDVVNRYGSDARKSGQDAGWFGAFEPGTVWCVGGERANHE